MPNTRLTNAVPSARSAGGGPNARVSAVQSGLKTAASSVMSISSGMPIGLLLALTYAADIVTTTEAEFYSDYRPSVRITNL